ncbi:MAG: helix-turn-helix domain-containing protein [Minisyncoccia bacterium]
MREQPYVLSLWRGWIMPPCTMAGILQEVAQMYDVTVEDLKGECRSHWIVHPRQHAMHMMVKTGRFSLPQIGRFLGGRDHTTVLHGYRAHEKRTASAAIRAVIVKSNSSEMAA